MQYINDKSDKWALADGIAVVEYVNSQKKLTVQICSKKVETHIIHNTRPSFRNVKTDQNNLAQHWNAK